VKMQLTAFDGPFSKTPYRLKNLAKIFYTKRVIANFVLNFVAMATNVDRAKMQLAAFDGPFPKIFISAQKSRKNFLLKPSYRQFCLKFRCQCNWQHSMAHPWRTPYRRKDFAIMRCDGEWYQLFI